jgi:hypothetical protein
MRVIGREHDVVGPPLFERRGQTRLLYLEREPRPRAEGAVRVSAAVVSGRELVMLFDAVRPRRRPATPSFEEADTETWEALEDPGQGDVDHRGHLLEDVADDVTAGVAGHPVKTDGVDAGKVGLMQ